MFSLKISFFPKKYFLKHKFCWCNEMATYQRYKRIHVSELQKIAKSLKVSINTGKKITSGPKKGRSKTKTRRQLIADTLKKPNGKKKLEDALYEKRGQERPRVTCPPYQAERGYGGVHGYSSFNADITEMYGDGVVTVNQRIAIWHHCKDKGLNKAQLNRYIKAYLKKKPAKKTKKKPVRRATKADMIKEIKKQLGGATKSDLIQIGKILGFDF